MVFFSPKIIFDDSVDLVYRSGTPPAMLDMRLLGFPHVALHRTGPAGNGRPAAFDTGFGSMLGELQAFRWSSGGHSWIFTAGLYENARFLWMPT